MTPATFKTGWLIRPRESLQWRFLRFIVGLRRLPWREKLYRISATLMGLALLLGYLSPLIGKGPVGAVAVASAMLASFECLRESYPHLQKWASTVLGKAIFALIAATLGHVAMSLAQRGVAFLIGEDPSNFPHTVWLFTIIATVIVSLILAAYLSLIIYTGIAVVGTMYHTAHACGVVTAFWSCRNKAWFRLICGRTTYRPVKPDLMVTIGRCLGLIGILSFSMWGVNSSQKLLNGSTAFLVRATVFLDYYDARQSLNLPAGSQMAYLRDGRISVAEPVAENSFRFRSLGVERSRKTANASLQ